MEHTSNYLKTVFLDLRQENKANPAFIFIILALLSLPLSYACNSISVALIVLVTLITFKKSNFRIDRNLLLPIFLFGLMSISLVWTADFTASLKALQKELPLLLLPLCFMAFPAFTTVQKRKILQYFSYGMVLYTIYWLIRACVRFSITKDSGVFFYHELVSEDVNAIHVSVYIAVAIFYFVTKLVKSRGDKLAMLLLALFMVLLSSKNIMVIFLILIAIYSWRYFKSNRKSPVLKWGLLFILIVGFALFGKIKDRFLIEFESNTAENTINHEIGTETEKVYNVSIRQAWSQEKFKQNDYFPGTAFRVYQIRVFKEILEEDPVFFTGFGLNAADFRIQEKGLENGVYSGNGTIEGYQNQNFHNEYIQLFAELGIFGFLTLIAMLVLNLKNALNRKDFIHISFAILMISLFLTESFLSRQRGIVFFTIMFCLFNSDASLIGPKKE